MTVLLLAPCLTLINSVSLIVRCTRKFKRTIISKDNADSSLRVHSCHKLSVQRSLICCWTIDRLFLIFVDKKSDIHFRKEFILKNLFIYLFVYKFLQRIAPSILMSCYQWELCIGGSNLGTLNALNHMTTNLPVINLRIFFNIF